MSTFDFRGSRIGRQFIAGGDMVFDQRGQTVGQQTNVGETFQQHRNATPSTRDRAEFEHWWAGLRQRPTDPKELAWLAWHAQATGDY